MGTVNLNEKNMMFGFNMGGKHEFLLNTLISISKWSIWKARNKVKYDKIHINQNVLCNIWKQTLKFELQILLTANLVGCPVLKKTLSYRVWVNGITHG